MIEIKKPGGGGANVGTIYKTTGSYAPFIPTNINTNPILLISATSKSICIVNCFFSFGDEFGGITDGQFYLVNSSFFPFSIINVQSALVSFAVGSGPSQLSFGIYSGTQATPTIQNTGSDIYLTQISDSTSGWQFLKWTIYYTLIPYSDIYP
jgi:hypothetical protein